MRALALTIVCACLVLGCGRRVDPAVAVAQANQLLAEGKPGTARVLLKNALRQDPSFAAARVLLAGIALDEGNAQAARDEISAAHESELGTAEAVAMRVRIALALNDAGEAARIFDAQGAAIPEPDRSILHARVLVAKDEAPAALALLRGMQQQGDSGQGLAIEVAETLAAMGDVDSAIAELDRYIGSGRESRSDALLARGKMHLVQGAPDKAKEDFTSALSGAPAQWPQISRITAELMIADSMLAAGDIGPAHEQIARIDKQWPDMLGTEVLGAHLALLEGRPGEAASRLTPIAEGDPDNVRLQYLLIDALSRSGNIARAAELLERRVAQEPASLSARQALASLYMQQGRPDRVIELLDRTSSESLLENESNDDLLAAARQARKEALTAAATLSKEVEARPGNPDLRARLAAAQTATGDPAAALVTLGPMPTGGWTTESAVARMSTLVAMSNEFETNRLVDRLLDPSSGVGVEILLATADVAYGARQVASTGRLLDRASALEPSNSEVQLRRASLAFDARDFAKATAILEPMVAREPGQQRARLALARVAEAQGNMERARALLAEAVNSDRTAEEPALALAALELRTNRPAESSRVLDQFVAAVPDGSAARAAGLLLADEGRFEEARTRFRQAVDREPMDARHWFNLGQSQLALVDNDAATGSFVKAAELEPSSIVYATAAVQFLLQQKNFAAARRTADAAAAALPDNAVAALLQGDVARAEGNFAVAEAAFARSYALNPSAQAALGEFDARRHVKAARPDEPLKSWLAREPDDLEARRALSDFYIAEDMDEEAQEQLESTLKRVPNDMVALNNLAWLLRQKNASRAEQLAVQASAIAPDNPDVADTLQTIRKIQGNEEKR